MIILVLPIKEVDITYLKTLISDFHTNQIGNEVFEVSALLLGVDRHLLMIKSFRSAEETIEYYNLFREEIELSVFLKPIKHRLMPITIENFPEFYKYKDVEGYYEFVIKN